MLLDEVHFLFPFLTHPLLSMKKYFLNVILLNKYVCHSKPFITPPQYSESTSKHLSFPSESDQTCIFINGMADIFLFLNIIFRNSFSSCKIVRIGYIPKVSLMARKDQKGLNSFFRKSCKNNKITRIFRIF